MMIFKHNHIDYKVAIHQPIDISLPIKNTPDNTRAWFVPVPKIEPVMENGFIGDVNKGGAVNFKNVTFNPHGNGTHTECVGHISKEKYSINDCLQNYFFIATLISVTPQNINGDQVITQKVLANAFTTQIKPNALIIRTLPNTEKKKNCDYSGTNPPYLSTDAVTFILEQQIDHVLVDVPSFDKENDGGKVAAHHLFWNYPKQPKIHRTITELVYVPNNVVDGDYFLNLMVAAFDLDATPSKPILYPIERI